MSLLGRCSSYRKSTEASKERQGPTIIFRFSRCSSSRERIGSFSNDDGDSNKSVRKATVSLLALKGHLYKMDTSIERSSRVDLCLPLLLLVDSVFFLTRRKKPQGRLCLFTSSIEREIRHFHVVVVQKTGKKCTKKRDARAKLLLF